MYANVSDNISPSIPCNLNDVLSDIVFIVLVVKAIKFSVEEFVVFFVFAYYV